MLRCFYKKISTYCYMYFFIFTCLIIHTSNVYAETFKPLIIYEGNIEGNSFNKTIHEGVEHFVEKTGEACKEIIVSNKQNDYMKNLKKSCNEGYSPIFLLYGNHFEALPAFVHQYPSIRFITLGIVKDEPNLFSLDFAEHEGSFLAGALAAMASKSKIIGFVSVSDLPLMRRFSCGYRQGAKYIDPDITVLVGFIGSYQNAWFDGKATAKMANEFMDEGADVI
ncbi:BMP family ABC transporter substrate-binding protein [Desulfovibrio inopinatus]|uniref:BMP family ABC transporter substrate-binding protein n=1 Tax=Desulfovibrio inopinatus TaxID=102109 RepID=UPI0006872DB5|nr:BMP family ABC transporter substrate-binding protein [Desulfovibrio inopinatus]